MDSLNHRVKSISRERLILTLTEYIPREIYKLCRLHGQSQQQDPTQTVEKPNIELHLHLDLASAQCYQLPTSVPSDHQTSSFRKVLASRVEVEKIFRACSQHFSHRTLQLSGIEGQILRQAFSDIQKIIHNKTWEKMDFKHLIIILYINPWIAGSWNAWRCFTSCYYFLDFVISCLWVFI